MDTSETTTSSFSGCEEVIPELAAYALGDEPLTAPARVHLQGCKRCQQLLHSYRHVSEALPFSAPQLEPPSALRERLIAAVQAEEEAAQQHNAATPPARARLETRPVPVRALQAALAAALAVIIALLGWNLSLQQQIKGQADQLVESRQGWQTLIVLMDDPTVQVFRLSGDSSYGTLWGTPAGQTGCIMLEDLPSPSPGMVYQVWLRDATGWSSAGVFDPHGPKAWYIFEAQEALQHYSSVMITIEPAGGSNAPGSTRVADADLAVRT